MSNGSSSVRILIVDGDFLYCVDLSAVRRILKHIREAIFAGLLMASCLFGACSETSRSSRKVALPVVDGNDIRFTRLHLAQGQFQDEVNRIVQDDQGFMWFGTSDGLRRYDGYGFREYRHDLKDPNSISGATVYSLFKDRAGRLWVGSDAFLDMFDPVTDRFTHFSGPGTAGINSLVLDVREDRNGVLWVSSYQGLYRVNPATWETVHYRHEPDDSSSLSSNLVKSTFEERDGTFWVVTEEGLDLFDRGTGKVTRHVSLMNGVEPLRMSLFQDHAGVLWAIFSSKNGLASVDRASNKVTQYSFNDGSGQNTGVDSIYEDVDGTLWLGTGSSGLLKLDRDRKRFVRYRSNPRDPESLSSGIVLALFEDREGSIWAGTRGGITRFDRRASPFQTYQPKIGSSVDQDAELSAPVFEDSHGVLWIGSAAVRNRIEGQTERFSYYGDTGNYGRLFHSAVRSIAEDRSGSLWFGTYAGLNRINPRTHQFKAYRHHPRDPQSLSNDNVPSLFVDHKGALWVGTMDGLDLFDPVTERFRTYRTSGDGLNQYQVIAEDSKGSLWLGTEFTGLQRLDLSTGRFTIFRNRPGTRGSLSNDNVAAICIDSSGIIWIGTQNGLDRFDPTTQTFTAYYERDGLPGNLITGIHEDERGNLWLSTRNGLSRFDPRVKTFANYSASDGIVKGNIYGPHAGWKGSRGEIFFDSTAGVIAFSPERVVDNSYVAPVVLTGFQLFGKPVAIGGDSPLNQSITATNSLTLSAAQNVFSLEFSVLSFVSPEQNRYRYRLEGLETEWNETSSAHRRATYTTLPPGDYVFRVQGSNNRGLWNEGLALRLRILPPWWKTWRFLAICAALILLLLWLLYRVRIRQLQLRERKFQEVIETIPAMAFTARPDGSRTFVSRRWLDYTGLSVEQAAGHGWQAAVHPDDLNRVREKWRVSVATGEPLEYETRLGGTDAEYRWFLTRAVPLRDAQGNIRRWCGITTDIEDRKQAEEARAEIEEQWRAAFVSNPTMYFIVDAARDIVVVNRFGAEQLGYTVDDLIGRPVLSVFHEPDRETVQNHAQECFEQPGRTLTWEARKIRKDGTMLWVRETANAVSLRNRPVLLVVCEDITEQKRAEDAARRSESELRALIENVPAMMFMALPGPANAFASRGWREYTGLSAEDTEGLGWQGVVHPEDLQRHMEKWRVCSATGEPFEDESRFRRAADGEHRWFLVRAEPLRDEIGNILKWYGVLTDIEDRKQAEQALRRSEAYLSEAQRLSHTGSWAYKSGGGAPYWSEENFRIWGFDPQQGVPDLELVRQRIHPEDRERAMNDATRATQAGTDFAHEFRIVLPDGTVRHVQAVGHLLSSANGEVIEVVGTHVDVTEHKRAEEALQRSEAYLAEAQSLSHTGSFVYDPVTRKTPYWSDELFRIFGFDPQPDHLAPPDDFRMVHPDDFERVSKECRKAFGEKAEFTQDYRLLLRDKTLKHLHVIWHPILDKDGELVEYVGTAADVTERKRAEEALRRSEAYLAEAQRLTHTGSWAYKPGGDAPYWSEENFRIWGFDPDQGPPDLEMVRQRIHPEDRERAMEYSQREVGAATDYDQEFRIVLPGGTVRHIHSSGHPVLSAIGEVIEIVGTHVDVTERKRAEKEREKLRQLESDLAHMNRVTMLGELASSLAHELNQPIAAAITSAHACLRWLTRNPPDLERARAATVRIERDGSRAADIVHRLRMFYKTGAPPQRELIDINEIVGEMLVLLHNEATGHSISLRTELAPRLPQIMADRVQLQQVLMNLMLNGIQAMTDGAGELTIRSQRTDDGLLTISVSDTGVGLPKERVDLIFNAFYTTKPQGTGMGLAISRSIIEAHGGRLWATANEQRGATFHFTVPAEVHR